MFICQCIHCMFLCMGVCVCAHMFMYFPPLTGERAKKKGHPRNNGHTCTELSTPLPTEREKGPCRISRWHWNCRHAGAVLSIYQAVHPFSVLSWLLLNNELCDQPHGFLGHMLIVAPR